MNATNPLSQEGLERIAAGLTDAQRALILRYEPVLTDQPITQAECFDADGPELFVELEPEQYENGCLIDPGRKAWFASTCAHSPEGSTDWRCTIRYYETGLRLRSHLLKGHEHG
jgi:hypothetical protein